MGKKNNLRDSVNFARVINRLKSPDLINIFVQNTDDKNLMNFYRIIANLIYSDKFGQNPRIKKKINKLRTIMQPFKGKWLKLTKKSSQNMREKRKFMLEQTGNGSIWSIISSILPLLLALLWFVVRNSGEGKQTQQLGVYCSGSVTQPMDVRMQKGGKDYYSSTASPEDGRSKRKSCFFRFNFWQ